MKVLNLTSGLPGSGKSTFLREQIKEGCVRISRDDIRFSLLKDGEDYFAHEDEVVATFYQHINEALSNDAIHTIYVDATHISRKARAIALSFMDTDRADEVNCICFTTPKHICLERNRLRTGRACVPDSAIHGMAKARSIATKNEGFNHIYVVDAQGVMNEKK